MDTWMKVLWSLENIVNVYNSKNKTKKKKQFLFLLAFLFLSNRI